jgi:threonine/homoserine/homoserine lactone efflux protein
MTEIIITVAIAGLLAGFIFSMPVAGPISILITSNAFKGKARYCRRVTIGASFADFFYVFVAFFGLTKLYSLYKPAIPYILAAGAVFILYTGFRIMKTKVDPEHMIEPHLSEKIRNLDEGGFYSGFMINFLNPTLFFGWLTTSFLVISFMAAMGFDTGGLDTIINENIKKLNIMEGAKINNTKAFTSPQIEKIRSYNLEQQKKGPVTLPKHFHLLISAIYAFSLAIGTIIWFYLLTFLITKFRRYINLKIINGIIYGLGIFLCLFGIYFGYIAIKSIFFASHI